MTNRMKYALSGAAAGAVNGLFGGGGGMVLAPALTGWCHMEQKTGAGHLRGSHPAFVPAVGGHQPVARSRWTGCRPCPICWGDWAAASWEAACFRRYPTCGCGASSPAFCCTAA